MERYCISIDWLQVYCLNNLQPVPETLYAVGMEFSVKKRSVGTPIWSEVYDIEYQSRECAVYCRCPRSSALDKFASTIKLANRMLYTSRFVDVLKTLINVLELKYKGVTRIDVCYDCNRLAEGRPVGSFLRDYMFHQPFCSGHIIRSGSRKVIMNAVRSMAGGVEISAMRWGSPKSDIQGYCYNKSLELLEEKDKPWIREAWERAGLVNVWTKDDWDELSESKKKGHVTTGTSIAFVQVPVWRFEISIQAHGKDLIDLNTGELFRIDLSSIDAQEKIESLFYTYAKKVFDFRMSTGQEKIRNYPELKIFEQNCEVHCKPVHINLFADTGRTEKICANVLEKLQATYSDMTSADRYAIESALKFLREISCHKAGYIRMKREANYLAHIQGQKFRDQEYLEYWDFVEASHALRSEVNAHVSYGFWESLSNYVAYCDAVQSLEREDLAL